jgi:hypothetical protein
MVDKTIQSHLVSVFNVTEWSHPQYETYKVIKSYVESYEEENRRYEVKDDKIIIRNNFKEQPWFAYSKSKPIISQLIDQMKLVDYIYDKNEFCLNLYVVLAFDNFKLNGCLYKNTVNDCINYYISLENHRHQKAYLTYYTHFHGVDANQKLKLPEFNKIYDITKLSQTILYQGDLLNFFAEIIMYYDESNTIGDLPIGVDLNVTLNQLVEKFNIYLSQKRTALDYVVI